MKKENAVIFGVTGVVVAAVLIGGGIYMKTERDRNLNADTASTAADSNRAEEVQKAVFLAEDSGLWYLGDLEHGNIYVTHTPSDTLYGTISGYQPYYENQRRYGGGCRKIR